eukprot:TRINITY_DN14623_c0_g1_i1.p6 TRINITY_DN14623_c0_g1~~TRINITY_DN14623_c0_g1_i1.p6  ORF type:complete len:103 (-),score=18.61 TRINITY_DN14623_c0_g1_i1:801-1109(-)
MNWGKGADLTLRRETIVIYLKCSFFVVFFLSFPFLLLSSSVDASVCRLDRLLRLLLARNERQKQYTNNNKEEDTQQTDVAKARKRVMREKYTRKRRAFHRLK